MDNPTKYAVGILGGSYVFQNSDAETIFTALEANGFTEAQSVLLYGLNLNESKEVLDILYSSWVTHGVYSKLLMIYLMMGGTAATHALNGINPALFSIDWINAPTQSALGVGALNGTTQFGKTGVVPSVDFTINDISLGVYSQADTQEDERDMGCQNSSAQRILFDTNRSAGTILCDVYNSSGGRLNGGISGEGQLVYSRRAVGDVEAYLNGVSAVTDNSGGGSQPTLEMYVGSMNIADAPSTFTTKTYSFIHFGLGMTTAEVLDFFTDLEVFQDALGRGVV